MKIGIPIEMPFDAVTLLHLQAAVIIAAKLKVVTGYLKVCTPAQFVVVFA